MELVLAAAVMLVASAVQGSVGFGANLIAVPALVLIDPRLVPGPALVAVAGLNLLMVARDGNATSLRPLGTVLGGRLAGTVIGVLALTAIGPQGLELLVGSTVLVAVALTATGLQVERTRRNLVTAGAVSGFGASTAGIGGPPLAVLYADAEGPEIRGAMGVLFSVGNVLSLVGLAAAGILDRQGVGLGLILAPAALVGFGVSSRVVPFLDRGRTRPAVLTLSAGAGVVVLARLALG
ncbi:MAG: sulfite exporter TauE/SafE family protein [Actinomycetota bacterium]